MNTVNYPIAKIILVLFLYQSINDIATTKSINAGIFSKKATEKIRAHAQCFLSGIRVCWAMMPGYDFLIAIALTKQLQFPG